MEEALQEIITHELVFYNYLSTERTINHPNNFKMQLSAALMLSGLAMLSTSAAAPNAIDARQERVATFETYSVPGCDSDVGRVQYQRVTPGQCRTLAPAQSIKIFYTSIPSCRG